MIMGLALATSLVLKTPKSSNLSQYRLNRVYGNPSSLSIALSVHLLGSTACIMMYSQMTW